VWGIQGGIFSWLGGTWDRLTSVYVCWLSLVPDRIRLAINTLLSLSLILCTPTIHTDIDPPTNGANTALPRMMLQHRISNFPSAPVQVLGEEAAAVPVVDRSVLVGVLV